MTCLQSNHHQSTRLIMKTPEQGGDTLVAAALDPALEEAKVLTFARMAMTELNRCSKIADWFLFIWQKYGRALLTWSTLDLQSVVPWPGNYSFFYWHWLFKYLETVEPLQNCTVWMIIHSIDKDRSNTLKLLTGLRKSLLMGNGFLGTFS